MAPGERGAGTLRLGDLIDNMLTAMLEVLRGKQTAITQEMAQPQ